MKENKYGLVTVSLILAVLSTVGIFLLISLAGETLSLPEGKDVADGYGGTGALAWLLSLGVMLLALAFVDLAVLCASAVGLLTAILSLRHLRSRGWRITAISATVFHGVVTTAMILPVVFASIGAFLGLLG